MSRILLSLGLLAALTGRPAAAQDQPGANGRKQARATRVSAGTIRVDGRLDEEAWQQAPAIDDFVQMPARERFTAAECWSVPALPAVHPMLRAH